jgi:hypothetical protein
MSLLTGRSDHWSEHKNLNIGDCIGMVEASENDVGLVTQAGDSHS